MKAALCCWALFVAFATDIAVSAASNRFQVEVREPAGVHRDASPVHVLLTLPRPVATSTGFRLTHQGNTVVAQFRPTGSDSEASAWWLDFIASSAPNEKRVYVVEYGPDVEPGPERTSGHQLVVKDDAFIVSNAPYIDWTIPRDFLGFLRSVQLTPTEQLRPDSIGLTFRDRDGDTHPLGGEGTEARVVRQGRMAVALRFGKTESLDALAGVRWTADLILPGPVSWVDLQVNIDDPENRIAEVGMQLNLNLDEPTGRSRTLVELGAARTIYRSLLGSAQVELQADDSRAPPWQVLRGVEPPLDPFVVASEGSASAAGWAHVMDRKRCLAIAFDRFGRDGEQRINVRADGRLNAVKRFAPASLRNREPPKRWRAWLHFVPFPPQQSANTDPHMMQHPLIARQVGQ